MPRSRFRFRPHLRGILLTLVALFVLTCAVVVAWVVHLDRRVVEQFEGRRWSVPARVYAQPIELYAGAPFTAEDLERELKRLHYRAGDPARGPGLYRRRGGEFDLHARRVRFADETRDPVRVSIRTDRSGIAGLERRGGEELPLFRLDPLLIGSYTPVHGEDRLVLGPNEVPKLLSEGLKAVEDRRFDRHGGVDFRALARAFWANLRAGRVEQGGSTLTQQLVKNYFLNDAQTYRRKLQEAVMAVRLERRFGKAEILNAYVNEVYLGQDGQRAVHGFGLASQFYFAKPLDELALHETALLVGLVKGPSFYDPRRHPKRAKARRDLVLRQFADAGLATEAEAKAAQREPLGIRPPGGAYVPAYLDLVRRHLKRDYGEADLAAAGLAIHTSLDPRAQAVAERALTRQLDRLDKASRRRNARLEGAMVIADPNSGDVIALVGGRDTGFDGFNRALDARRPIGSLVKPAVFLAALETGRYGPHTIVDDAPIELKLADGKRWAPQNYTREVYGPVPLVYALGESLNLATVRLGLDVGLPAVARTLTKLGVERRPPPNPSLLLGALELSPLEVAQLYAPFANGGFKARLRTVRAVVDSEGKALRTFPVQVEQVAHAATVYQLDRMLVQVVERGTGRAAGARLGPDVVAAGKTGTSNDTRDSWFAGFTGSHLAVVWVGYDDYQPTGQTGGSGALPIWAETMASLRPASFDPPVPELLEERWIEYATGYETRPDCSDQAARIATVQGVSLPAQAGCPGLPGLPGGDTIGDPVERAVEGVVDRVRSWFERARP
ncbi:MAG: penicillin-binding protein 1B [Steroidobacteraceae bacterium]|jgi:penicillin-binding protein 1B|nr:penicillin-binding protein 1B [Steroidobacteraceae bacterium]